MSASQHQPLYAHDPELYEEILSWPNTPGHKRYTAAAQAYHDWERQNELNLTQNPDGHIEGFPSEYIPFNQFTDLHCYSDLVAAALLAEETSAEFQMDVDAEPQNALELVMQGARQGCTHSTIGLARCRLLDSTTGLQTLIAFGRTSRHPDWMGMTPLFDAIEGFTAFIFQEPGCNAPSFVILTDQLPASPGQHHQHHSQCPQGQAQHLKDLLTRLGTTPLWLPWDGDYQHRPNLPIHPSPVAETVHTDPWALPTQLEG